MIPPSEGGFPVFLYQVRASGDVGSVQSHLAPGPLLRFLHAGLELLSCSAPPGDRWWRPLDSQGCQLGDRGGWSPVAGILTR